MSMKNIIYIFILSSYCLSAQYSIKIKREDNRFLFFQLDSKSDTLIKNKNDLFLIKLPDSLKKNIQINICNGQFVATNKEYIYKLKLISGMKYSHTKPDSIFMTLLEGTCPASKLICIDFFNTLTQQSILKNNFISK